MAERESKLPRISYLLYHSTDETTYTLDTTGINTLGELIQKYPQHFTNLQPENITSTAKNSYFTFTSTLTDWKSKLTKDTPLTQIKSLIPVYYLTLHRFYITVNRTRRVDNLIEKLTKFLKERVDWAKEERSNEDFKQYDSSTDYKFKHISHYPFKLVTSDNETIEIFNLTLALCKSGMVDYCGVLFEDDTQAASSLNIRLFFNEYEKLVFPRDTSWRDFEQMIDPRMKECGLTDYVIVKLSSCDSWNPIVKPLDRNKPVFPQIESRDNLFAVESVPLPEIISGTHVVYVKSDTNDKVLKKYSVDPEMYFEIFIDRLGITTVYGEVSPLEIFWDNHQEEPLLEVMTLQMKDIPQSSILRFSFDESTDIKCRVFTPDCNFQEIQVDPQTTTEELHQIYLDFLKTTYDFHLPSDSRLIYRSSGRKRNIWKHPANTSLQRLVRKLRDKNLYFSFRVPIFIQESKNSILTIFGNFNDSISRTLKKSKETSFTASDLCLLLPQDHKEQSRFQPIEKHKPTIHFLGMILLPFARLIVNKRKIICPFYQSIAKTMIQNGIWERNSTITLKDGTNKPLAPDYLPEDIVSPHIPELTQEYEDALEQSSSCSAPFAIERMSWCDFNIDFLWDNLPNSHLRIRVDPHWPNKPHQIFFRNTTNNSLTKTKVFYFEENWEPTLKNFSTFVKQFYQLHFDSQPNEQKRLGDFQKYCNSMLTKCRSLLDEALKSKSHQSLLNAKYAHARSVCVLESMYNDLSEADKILCKDKYDELNNLFQDYSKVDRIQFV